MVKAGPRSHVRSQVTDVWPSAAFEWMIESKVITWKAKSGDPEPAGEACHATQTSITDRALVALEPAGSLPGSGFWG